MGNIMGGKVLEYDNCESIPEAADIPCISLYPLDRYAGSNTIHICLLYTSDAADE